MKVSWGIAASQYIQKDNWLKHSLQPLVKEKLCSKVKNDIVKRNKNYVSTCITEHIYKYIKKRLQKIVAKYLLFREVGTLNDRFFILLCLFCWVIS